MVKLWGRFECVIGVTLGAIGSAVVFKLLIVDVVMAIGTLNRHAGKFLPYFPIGFLLEMAVAATLLHMCPDQCKFGFPMIKIHQVPAIFRMTILANRFRIIFFTDVWFVNILVAIDASFSNFPEAPFFGLLVTGKTRSGHVGALEWKDRAIVLFDCIGRSDKSFHCMAL